MENYLLRYRTFDQLLEDVTVDLKNTTLENRVNPAGLIKVARRCNYELGLRIHKTRQTILDVENYKVRLPEGFYKLNYALVCGAWEITEALPQGTHIEERPIPAPVYTPYPVIPDQCALPPDPCDPPDPCTGVCINQCGEEFQLVQKIKMHTRTFKFVYPLHIKNTKDLHDLINEEDCLNSRWTGCENSGTLEDGFLKLNFKSGKVYLNYEGDLVDDDGNLLVPDHELLNEFYEYALKQRIFENMYLNGDDTGQRMQLIEARLRASRNNAMSLVNTPNFKELQEMWRLNRVAQYSKYYNMFNSFNYKYGKEIGYSRHF